jgi:hypothetical protein
MNWEVPAVVILVLALAVEAILALRPITESAALQPNEGGCAKPEAGPTAAN